jgi:hypothetical protein
MKLMTPQTLASEARSKWEEQYRYAEMDHRHYSWAPAVAARLAAIGENPSPQEVNEAIGNDSWTKPPSCNECGRASAATVQVGEEPDYESRTAWLCRDCVVKALELFDEVTP